jgi:transcriptional regulator GlxA family with amidase domain
VARAPRSAGRVAIGELANELGWSHRRLIARFREQVGLAPKAAARVLRFDRAARALRSPSRTIGEVAFECGYFDQAHLNRDFRELAGITPRAFRDGTLETGGLAA